MSRPNPVSVSVHISLNCLDHSEKLQEDITYRKAVGSLMYLAVVTSGVLSKQAVKSTLVSSQECPKVFERNFEMGNTVPIKLSMQIIGVI
ncbi:hypothetical protein AVEN_63907-1 [Araneus ventricosus]|uniref:Retrovirus-related Pol polyprotein from transposon TNT 1-94 n=1 Tax=Araneus ventricosus TaxID=182803 RepID=A0A4Y2W982_ARAVE|nr:hypothetical protein AVEN_80429-1 [Araneus ventricosus]GBO33036.1 hypothetical protein AVEN_63907-1 [Araneus ventricosus]